MSRAVLFDEDVLYTIWDEVHQRGLSRQPAFTEAVMHPETADAVERLDHHVSPDCAYSFKHGDITIVRNDSVLEGLITLR